MNAHLRLLKAVEIHFTSSIVMLCIQMWCNPMRAVSPTLALSILVGGTAAAQEYPKFDGVYVGLSDGTYLKMEQIQVELADYNFALPNGELHPGGVYVENADKINIVAGGTFFESGIFAEEVKSIFIQMPDAQLETIGAILNTEDLLGSALEMSGGQYPMVHAYSANYIGDAYEFISPADCRWTLEHFDVRTISTFQREIFPRGDMLGTASSWTGRFMDQPVSECRGAYPAIGLFVQFKTIRAGSRVSTYYAIMLDPITMGEFH